MFNKVKLEFMRMLVRYAQGQITQVFGDCHQKLGEGMNKLIEEFQRLKDKNFELRFRYPTEEERRHLQIVHRDMTAEEKRHIENQQKELASLIKDLDAGKIHVEDLDEGLVRKLRDLLGK